MFEYRHLVALARKAKKFAYAPYSKFAVGSALMTEGGKTFMGANIENASYGLTLCSERAAVVNALLNGENKFVALALVGQTDKSIYPCGACLQVLAEFNPQLTIILNINGNWQIKKLPEFLPYIFQKD